MRSGSRISPSEVFPLRRDQAGAGISWLKHSCTDFSARAKRPFGPVHLTNDVVASHRPSPDMGKARDKLERRGRRHPRDARRGASGGSPHGRRLASSWSVSPYRPRRLTQRVKQFRLAALVTVDRGRVTKSSVPIDVIELAPSLKVRLRHVLEPLVQHMGRVGGVVAEAPPPIRPERARLTHSVSSPGRFAQGVALIRRSRNALRPPRNGYPLLFRLKRIRFVDTRGFLQRFP